MDFTYRRRFRWPWQGPEKTIDRARVEHFLDKGQGDRLSVGGLPLRSREDLEELDAFQAGRAPVQKPELGQALLDLARGGWSFHGAAGQVGLYGAYNALTDPNFSELGSPAARKGELEVPLDPERSVRMAGFYNGNSLNARLEGEGYQFFSQGEPVAAFLAGPQASLGRDGEVWVETLPGDEQALRGQLERFGDVLGDTRDEGTARQTLTILDSADAPEEKARKLVELENSGLYERALDQLSQTYPRAAEAARAARQATSSSRLGRSFVEQAVADPQGVGLGQKLIKDLDDPEVARALLETQKGTAPELVKLGEKLLESETVGAPTAVLLEEIDNGQTSAPLDLARRLLAAGAEPQAVMRTLRQTPGWESTVTLFDRVFSKLEYLESAQTLASALLKGSAPADKKELLARVYQGLGEDERETIVEVALKHLDPGPESKAARKLARALEQPELALATPSVAGGQDVLAMGRAALSSQETLSEEAGQALLGALAEHKETKELGRQAGALTSELSLEATHVALQHLLSPSGDLLTTGRAVLDELRSPDLEYEEDANTFSRALLKQLSKQYPVADKATTFLSKLDEDDGQLASLALEQIEQGRGADLEGFRAGCVGLGLDEMLERQLRGTPVYPLYRELADQAESDVMREALLESALRQPQAASKPERRELLHAAFRATDNYTLDDEEALAADRERLGETARDLLGSAERKLADQLNEAVEPAQHWATVSALLTRPAPTSLDELAALRSEVTTLSPDGDLARNLLDILAAYPESSAGRQLIDALGNPAADVLAELTRALCQNPRASSPTELAALGATALDSLSEYPTEGEALAEALLSHFEEEPDFAGSLSLGRQLTDGDPASVAAEVLRHPRCETGQDFGRLGLDLYRQTDSLDPIGYALDAMGEKDDTRLGAGVAREVFDSISAESAELLAETLTSWCHDLNALAINLKSAADRGETAGEDEPEAVLYDDVELLRASAMKLEALALTQQKASTQIEERGHQIVVGGVTVPVRQVSDPPSG